MEDSFENLMTGARENKIVLGFLRSVEAKGHMREKEESNYLKIIWSLGTLAENLRNFDYALIKFSKAVSYVPSDIDLLILEKDLPKAAQLLEQIGYAHSVREPFSHTFLGPSTVDIYIHPCIANLTYMDGATLLKHTCETKIDGVAVKTLSSSAEVVLVAAHAMYKEQLLTLNDCLTIEKWMNKHCMDFALETKTEAALNKSLAIYQSVLNGRLELPYKLDFPAILALFGSKIIGDAKTRSSIKELALNLRNTLLTSRVPSRVVRRTY